MMDFENIRQQFPLIKRLVNNKALIYLDNAATTPKPKRVIEAISAHYSNDNANIHRGVHTLSEEGTIKYEQTRLRVQALLNAKYAHEIVFTKGTTESINLVAECFCSTQMSEGDEIILSQLEHHSNIVPWQLVAEKYKLKIKVIKLKDDLQLDLEHFATLLSEKTKIVALNHTSNTLGIINPIAKIIEMAHKNGSKVLIDGAQAIAHEELDVQMLDVDFLAFSAHKMYGPTGVGVLYAKEALLEAMPPYQGGGDMIDQVSFEKTTFNELPHKFEAGTPNIAGVICFNEAIKFVQEIGFKNIQQHERDLREYATGMLRNVPNLKIFADVPNKAAVISFQIAGVHHHDLGTLLDKQGIAIRTGHHCTQPLMKVMNVTGTCRASFSLINCRNDIDQFINAINKAVELL